MAQDTPQTHRERLSHLIDRPAHFGAVEWLVIALGLVFACVAIASLIR